MSEQERYQKIKEIFEALLEISDAEKERYLVQVCDSDEIRQEVDKLLAAHRRAGTEWEKRINLNIAKEAADYLKAETSYLIGKKLLNRYSIQSKLNEEGVGVTYLALDEQLHMKSVVIKVLFAQQEYSEWAKKRFHQEIAALSRINHPGVTTIFDSGTTPNGRLFFVTEFVKGRLLRSVISPTGMEFSRVANIIQQLGRALTAAHENGVYHSDLKPENIRLQSLDGREQVKIIDFGMATVKKSLDETTTDSTLIMATTPYIAPEQLQGKPSVASDIYALGIVAYEMLTGQLPFKALALPNQQMAISQLLQWQQDGLKVRPKALRLGLSDQAEEEILKALSYNPQDRQKRAHDFGDRLAAALLQAPLVKERQGTLPFSNIDNLLTERIDSPRQNYQPLRAKYLHKFWLIPTTTILAVMATIIIWQSQYMRSNVNQSSDCGKTSDGEHLLSYYAELQQYRNNQPFGLPMQLTNGISGESYFHTGDGLRFYLTASEHGYLYLINEATKPTTSKPIYTILFPSYAANNGLSEVNQTQEIKTSECIFDENMGMEKVWIIWSVSPIEMLEKAVQQWSNIKDSGEIKEDAQIEFLSHLIRNYAENKTIVELDDTTNRVNLKIKGEIMIYLLRLKHL